MQLFLETESKEAFFFFAIREVYLGRFFAIKLFQVSICAL